MYFMIYSQDKPESLDIRKANRDAHLVWLKSDPVVTVKLAGPWLDEHGDMRGSLVIVECKDEGTVRDWLTKDPYAQAGLIGAQTLKPFHWAIGGPQ